MNDDHRDCSKTLDWEIANQDDSWSDWAGEMTITAESEDDGSPITTLTGVVADQAALQSLLRRL